ncbi:MULTISPECIES: HdeD family acid-resistance protein [unclassified Pseudomonas]|uniref:HdeD family acid-resistance protein n=1 Tax=unclassified Pseudomonas TaxID=196821 RepID=UPI002AC9D4CB|nr:MULTISPECIES: DUF308 domain-containing protein [unclassified Pseudomonas]MEB0046547.1 hypothetical protein [Pseudomonas sp. Dout3]MEB0095313.1 hypothetical protein [Pseudomonas sp. DC1.2]WPX60900.1 hypothetical protein RHM68_09795 [Pseudomonas sp. DC1.2]
MVRLSMILLGHDFVRRRWSTLALVGVVWAIAGVAIFIDALDGVTYFPLHVFGYLLLAEAVIILVVPAPQTDTASALRKARGVGFLVLGLLIVDSHHVASLILAVLFGVAFFADGCFRLAAAVVVRFAGWPLSLLTGLFEITFAVFILEPYPTLYAGTVPYCIGMSIFLSGCVLLRQSFRLKGRRSKATACGVYPLSTVQTCAAPLVIHVWTPSGTADNSLVSNPLLNRYIAAVDINGVVSAGHAALECAPEIYVSHYPEVDIDHSAGDFVRLLRATPNNNVVGRFLPSYVGEVAEWCESSVQVRFGRYDSERLREFWRDYRQDTTYNLTSRNCSSAVARCLEAALEGAMNRGHSSMMDFFRVVMSPEFWVAAQLRKRAEAMAWTPGLLLDYARALNAAIEPKPAGWYSVYAGVKRACRYASAALKGQALRSDQPPRQEPAKPPADKP